jgi:hypothetical protein
MSGINIIINVAMIISTGWLVWWKSPFIINNKLVLMNASLQRLYQYEFITISLHRDPFLPWVKTTYQWDLVASETPCEYISHLISLMLLLLLSILLLLHITALIIILTLSCWTSIIQATLNIWIRGNSIVNKINQNEIIIWIYYPVLTI